MSVPRPHTSAPVSRHLDDVDAIVSRIGDARLDALSAALARLLLSAARSDGRVRRTVGATAPRPIRRLAAGTKNAARG